MVNQGKEQKETRHRYLDLPKNSAWEKSFIHNYGQYLSIKWARAIGAFQEHRLSLLTSLAA